MPTRERLRPKPAMRAVGCRSPRFCGIPLSSTATASGDTEAGWVVSGRGPRRPFDPPGVTARAGRAWDEAALDRITLHECRHRFASLMIAAGVNAKALQTYM